MVDFNGLGMNLGNLSWLSTAESHSISAENPTGACGKGGMADAAPDGPARDLGRGWKCRPAIAVEPGEKVILADVEGPGAIQSIWMTGTIERSMILRIWWDGQATPSVNCPLPDFFAAPFAGLHLEKSPVPYPFTHINSLPICVNPNRGMNCFFEMPFRKRCVIEVENIHFARKATLFFQINYVLTTVPDQAAYFHVRFNRMNPLPRGEVYTILDGVSGKGHYVGTAMGWSISNGRWWGEGEVKFYLDSDAGYPTICGTGTEDYFLGAYDWDYGDKYIPYSTPYAGMYQVVLPDGLYNPVLRQAMYRWHVVDPVRFSKSIQVTIQALGWRDGGRYYPESPDICSTAYWYQELPTKPMPRMMSLDDLEIV